MPRRRQARWIVAGVSLLCATLDLIARAPQGTRVTGRLTTPDGRGLLNGAIMMAPTDDREAVTLDEARILPDGEFSFGRVPPGRYQIRARAQTQADGSTLFATFGLIVDRQDITNIEMPLKPGTPLSGQVIVQRRHARNAPALAGVMVRAPLADGSEYGDALTGRVGRDGSFAIRGLIAGTHHVAVEGLADGWTVSSVTIRGRDVTDQPFDVNEGLPLRDVRIVVMDDVSEVAGQVRNASDQPARDAAVLVFPMSPQFWIPGGRRLRSVRTDADGRFVLRSLPQGAYLAVASMSVDVASLRRTRALEQLRDVATAFSIAPDAARTTLDLKLVGEHRLAAP
jgi:hypothetical protein